MSVTAGPEGLGKDYKLSVTAGPEGLGKDYKWCWALQDLGMGRVKGDTIMVTSSCNTSYFKFSFSHHLDQTKWFTVTQVSLRLNIISKVC